jgi:hypothetical protein
MGEGGRERENKAEDWGLRPADQLQAKVQLAQKLGGKLSPRKALRTEDLWLELRSKRKNGESWEQSRSRMPWEQKGCGQDFGFDTEDRGGPLTALSMAMRDLICIFNRSFHLLCGE